MVRRKFTKEFKFEAVKLVTERGVAVVQAARDLDLAESVLRRWMREASTAPVTAFPGNGQQRAELAEIAALQSAQDTSDLDPGRPPAKLCHYLRAHPPSV
jgi:transposase